MKITRRILLLMLFTLMPFNMSQATRTSTYIWFDLGNVLIETRDGFDRLRWMPGAVEYMRQLRQEGFRIGLITNIPEDWGDPGDRPSKVRRLQEVISGGWVDDKPFDLAEFDEVLVPVFQVEAKPAAKLFVEAVQLSNTEGRVGFFEGESPGEVTAAKTNGMSAHLIVYEEDGKTPKYYPIEQLPH